MKKNQPITIDDLAAMVARGFDEMRQYMDRHFTGINNRLDEIEHQLVQIERRQDMQQSIIERHIDRIRTLEKKVGV